MDATLIRQTSTIQTSPELNHAHRRVAITGMSAWCSIGRNLDEFRQGLLNGVSGRRAIPERRLDTKSPVYRTRSAAVLSGIDDINELMRIDDTLLADLAVAVACDAVADSALSRGTFPANQIGVCLGTSVGGSFSFIRYLKNQWGLTDVTCQAARPTGSIAVTVAGSIGASGPVSTVSTACASGTNAVGRGFDWIRHGRAECVVVGGVDLFSELTFSGFNSLQALARGPCRPFDQDRDGLMLGDGAAFLVLEPMPVAKGRGARVYAEVAGYAIANEAHHATGPDPEGLGALGVMRGALSQAGLRPEEVGHIEAHGTGTKANDLMELKAISALLGEHASKTYVSSVKSMIGHTLGAAGSLELVATVLGIHYGFIPPTINLDRVIEGYENLRFARDRAVSAHVAAALSNSFGFGGNVASIAVKRYESD